jgi:hypothetical protein
MARDYTVSIRQLGGGVSEITLVLGMRKTTRQVRSTDVAELKRYAHEVLAKDALANSGEVTTSDDLEAAAAELAHPERATYIAPVAPQVIEVELAADKDRATDKEVTVSGRKYIVRARIDAVSLATAVALEKAEPIEEPIEEVKG